MAGINVTIDGQSYELTPYNAAIFVFPKEFASHNHLFVAMEEDNGIYVFGRQDIVDTLCKSGMLPIHYLPYVPDPDIAAYRQWVENGGTRHDIIDTTAREIKPLTEEEVAYYAKEFQEERVIDHWDELEGGEE